MSGVWAKVRSDFSRRGSRRLGKRCRIGRWRTWISRTQFGTWWCPINGTLRRCSTEVRRKAFNYWQGFNRVEAEVLASTLLMIASISSWPMLKYKPRFARQRTFKAQLLAGDPLTAHSLDCRVTLFSGHHINTSACIVWSNSDHNRVKIRSKTQEFASQAEAIFCIA